MTKDQIESKTFKKDFLDIIRMRLTASCAQLQKIMQNLRQSMQLLSQRTKCQRRTLWRTA